MPRVEASREVVADSEPNHLLDREPLAVDRDEAPPVPVLRLRLGILRGPEYVLPSDPVDPVGDPMEHPVAVAPRGSWRAPTGLANAGS